MKTGSKLCSLACTHGFTKIKPSDLVFYCITYFNSGLDFTKINSLTKFHEDWIETMLSRVYICFFFSTN